MDNFEREPQTRVAFACSNREEIMSLPMGTKTALCSSLCGCSRCAASLSRRRMLAATIGGMFTLIARNSPAQTTQPPDTALKQLMDGNARFVRGRLTSFDEDMTILKEKTVAKQEPFAAVLSCADSRVPVELVFDQSIGHVFVSRVAGNICTPEVIASLEYGVAVLGVPVIMVLGHDGCGAVKASIDAKAVPGQISALYAPLRAAVERAGPDLTATIKANAQIQAELLRTASPVIAGSVSDGKLKVVSAYYDLATGTVILLG
jgi:carbonic anhydrase